jgi:tetratricopeptide (TPR) repeat protein
VISGRASVVALAVAAALSGPWPAAAAPLEALERQAQALDDRLSVIDVTTARPDETAADRAARKFSEGETQFLLGDWLPAAILMLDAVEQPEFRTTDDYPQALAYLGDAFRFRGACDTALQYYDELLALGDTPARAAAFTGALDCRVKMRRLEGIDELVAAAAQAFPAGVPPEVGYLAAKTLYFRTDLRPAERLSRGLEAFAAVQPPFHLAAAYFEGVLELEAGDLATSADRFERCVSLPGKDPRQTEVRELCFLALGRIYAELGDYPKSLDAYQAIPRESERFNEALYEVAWNQVRAKSYELALRTASVIVDLAPESPLAPEATILTGHLNLELGRYAAANDAFTQVVDTYAPVRDEIDAVLTTHEDPVRYFNELIGRQGRAFDVTAVLPKVAVKWATTHQDVTGALDLVQSLKDAHQDLEESHLLADRIEASLTRGGGLDAAPLLLAGWAGVEAVRTDVARLKGQVVAGLLPAARAVLAPEQREELDRAESDRRTLEPRIEAMPRTPDDVEARRDRMLARIDQVERSAFQLGYQVDASAAAVVGTETWVEQHRSELTADETSRAELDEELHQLRAVVEGYRAELKAVDRDAKGLRDAASGSEGVQGEAKLRRDYLDSVDREQALVEAARPALSPTDAATLERSEALLTRLSASEERSAELETGLLAEAKRRAQAIRSRVDAERAVMAASGAALDSVDVDAQQVVGRIAFRSFSAVRAQFYRLVLKADVGLVDVAWSRKRDRVEQIQRLSQQKALEIEGMDHDFKALLREVE